MLKHVSASVLLVIAASSQASAAPGVPPSETRSDIILVRGGCGLGFHPTPLGDCVPNRGGFYGGPVVRRLPPPCPRFYHRDPDPARPLCYPN